MDANAFFKIERFDTFSTSAFQSVVDIQNSLAYGMEMIENGITEAPNGVMVSGYSLEDLQSNLERGAVFYLGRHQDSGSYAGFLQVVPAQCFSPKLATANMDFRTSDHTNWKQILANEKFVYLDQIGVAADHHRSGLAYQLLEAFESDHKTKTVVVLIMTAPLNNSRSTRFFKNNRYEIFADIHFPRFGLIDNFRGILLSKSL